jgi:hypothetical protein
MTLIETLDYPVLCLSQDTSISVRSDPAALGRCNAKALWTNRYFEGLLVFDASARRFRVTDAQPAAPVSPVRRLLMRLLNQSVSVRLRLEETGPPSVDAIKERVVEWIERDPEFWNAGGELAELKRRIVRAPNIPEIAAILR